MEPTLSPDQLLRCLQWRYAAKRFDRSRSIPAEVWHALEQALVLAPSSFGLQPWKFVVVTTPELREQLRLASWGQSQVTDASHYVVFAGLRTATPADVDRMIAATAETRGIAVEALARYRAVIVDFLDKGCAAADLGAWNARQVYIALGQFLVAAAMLGVDTSPLEGIDCGAYDRLLGLENTPYTTLCGCAAGYRGADDRNAGARKMRYPAEEIIERR